MIYDVFKSFIDDHSVWKLYVFFNLDNFRLPFLFILFMKKSYEMEKVHA